MKFLKRFGQSSCSTPSESFSDPHIPVEFYNDEDYLGYVEGIITSNDLEEFKESFRRLDDLLIQSLEKKSYTITSYLITERRFDFLMRELGGLKKNLVLSSLFVFKAKDKLETEQEERIMNLFFIWYKLKKDSVSEELKREFTKFLQSLDRPKIKEMYLKSYGELKRMLNDDRAVEALEFYADIESKRMSGIKDYVRKNLKEEEDILLTGFHYALELEHHDVILIFLFFGVKPKVANTLLGEGGTVDGPVNSEETVVLEDIDSDGIRDLLRHDKDRMDIIQEYIERIELNPVIHVQEKATDMISKEKNREIRKLEVKVAELKKKGKKSGGDSDGDITVSNYINSFKEGCSLDYPKGLLPRIKYQIVQTEFEEMVRMNISLLYWSKHLLDFHDRMNIDSPFYDAGGSRKFRPLEKFLSLPYKKRKGGRPRREVILIDAKRDSRLREVLKAIKRTFSTGIKLTMRHRYEVIMERVSKFFGGDEGRKVEKKCVKSIERLMKKSGRQVVLIGDIRYGVCRHRSLLFKFLCDQLQLTCRLIRGFMGTVGDEEKHAWCMVFLDGKFYMADVMNSMSLVDKIDFENYSRLGKGSAGGYSMMEYDVQLGKKNVEEVRMLDDTERGQVMLVKLTRQSSLSINYAGYKKYQKELENERKGKKKKKKEEEEENEGEEEEGKEEEPLLAMKIIPIKDEETKKSLEKELLIMKFLSHPNLMKCRFDEITQSKKDKSLSKMKILMDFMEYNGEQILKLLEVSDMSFERKTIETLIFLLSVAKGIRYLHNCSIVLHSLALKNILLNWNMKKFYIMDVKIAKFSAAGMLRKKKHNFDSKIDPDTMVKRAVDVKKFGEIIRHFRQYLKHYHQIVDLMKECEEGIIDFDMIVYILKSHLQLIYNLKCL